MFFRNNPAIASITRFLAKAWNPPAPDGEELTEKRRALSVILWNMLGICVFGLVYNEIDPSIGPHDVVLQGMGFLFLMVVAGYLLNSRGKTREGSILLIACQVALVTWLIIRTAGMNDLLAFWYLPVIFSAGMLLGGRAGFVTAILCIILLLGIFSLEFAGFLPASVAPPSPILKFRIFIELVVTISIIQYLASRMLRNVLRKTQKSEESLRQSEVRYRTLFETAGDAIFLMDKNRFIACNQRTLEIFRCTREQILGRTPSEFSPPLQPDGRQSAEKAREKLDQVFRGLPQFFEWQHSRSDGSLFDAEVTLNRVEIGSGNMVQAIVRDITERKKAEEQLKSSLEEKEILLKEVHHRVKNNMQVITSLLSLQAASISDRGMKDVFVDCQNRIHSMALIHELLYYSQIYGSVVFLDYCRRLVERLKISYRTANIGMEILGDSFTLELDQAVPCGLILNELVSNSLKHAFPSERAGNIRIEIRKEGTECRLSVSDDGVGMKKAVNPAELQSLGMRLITNLTEQIGGTFSMITPPGTVCTVKFPMTAQ